MLVTDRFVFIHLHRTGGQFVSRFIRNFFPSTRLIGYHYPRSLLPHWCDGLPVISFVRNPWDWYVSWYHFNHKDPKNKLFPVVSDGGGNDFGTTIRNLIQIGCENPHYREMKQRIIERLPDTLDGNQGAGITQQCLANFPAGLGYYTWLVQRMFQVDGAWHGITVGRFEQLTSDLVTILDSIGVPVDNRMKGYLELAEKVNTSRRKEYPNYYTEDLRELIVRWDCEIVEHFGYEFGR